MPFTTNLDVKLALVQHFEDKDLANKIAKNPNGVEITLTLNNKKYVISSEIDEKSHHITSFSVSRATPNSSLTRKTRILNLVQRYDRN